MKVYTGGTYDLFHAGHVEFLRRARALGKHLTVGLNPDDFVREFKREPVCTYAERKAVLEACRYVDAVVMNEGGADSKPAILLASPDIIAAGSDWGGRIYEQWGIDPEWLREHGIAVAFLPYTAGVSTSDIIARIR